VSVKYERFPQLLQAFIWRVHELEQACSFALTYDESFEVAKQMGWTETDSCMKHEGYSTTRPSKKLMGFLEPYRMEDGDWKRKVAEVGMAMARRV
jgi:hypothetical protein